jgi:transcriptional regulator with XRE-family HTH domain
MIYEEIGKRIQRARESAGLSQGELAAEVGLTQAALSNYELGKRRPSLANLEHIGDSLGKPLGYFLEESAAVRDREDERLDESIREMIELWYDMPEGERQYLLDFIRWRREQSKPGRKK